MNNNINTDNMLGVSAIIAHLEEGTVHLVVINKNL